MLYILTGRIQTGKTRWLGSMVGCLEDHGVVCEGVLAPGIWKETSDGSRVKLGISNELLPDHRTLRFALRSDLSCSSAERNPAYKAAETPMRWHIEDEAVQTVNAHFDIMRYGMQAPQSSSESSMGEESRNQKRVLVIDELGPLELLRGEGLTSAVKLLEDGPRSRYAFAIVVIRELPELIALAKDRFEAAWQQVETVVPSESTARLILARALSSGN